MKKLFTYKNFKIINGIIMIILVMATLFPFIYMMAVSFSSAKSVLAGEVRLLPKDFNVEAYKHIMEQPKFWNAYKNTVYYTVTGTLLSLVLTILCAYPLSRNNLLGKNAIMKFIIFTMFFTGGIIPNFLLIRDLKLIDTTWAMILPGAINAYNVMLMRTFFQSIPKELEEAAKIDGLTDVGVLWKIILPLSKPIIATIGLFVAVWLWNEWFMSLIYFTEDWRRPVSMFLRNMVMGSLNAAQGGQQLDQTATQNVPQTLQAATMMLMSLPIIAVYPFIQRYFVKGVMIGSVKG